MKYLAPSGSRFKLYSSMLNQSHLLVAGATGSGICTPLRSERVMLPVPSWTARNSTDTACMELRRI